VEYPAQALTAEIAIGEHHTIGAQPAEVVVPARTP
jgi:hypothetical protein